MRDLTLDAKLVRAAMANQAKKDVRYYLCGFLLAANGDIVATNGHILFKGQYVTDDNRAVDEDIIINIAGTIPQGANTVTLTFNDEHNGVAKTDNGKAFMFNVVDGRYPQYSVVIESALKPKESVGNVFCFDSTYLAHFEKTYGKGKAIRIYADNGMEAAHVECPAIPDSLMVIMPMRDDKVIENTFKRAQAA